MVERKTTTKKAEPQCCTKDDTLMAEATILAALINKGANGAAAVESAKHYVKLLKAA